MDDHKSKGRKKRYALCLLFQLAAVSVACAEDNLFLGQWAVETAIIAPWAEPAITEAERPEDPFIQRQVVIGPDAMTGPGPFSCSEPRYIVKLLAADIVFQGGLAVNPATPTAEFEDNRAIQAAVKLGLDRINIPTLQNRCSDLALHMADPDTVYFAVDSRIYTLKRAR